MHFEWACKLIGLRIVVDKRIDNDLETKPFIAMSTHGSIMDVCTLLSIYRDRLAFPTKESLFKVPFIGFLFRNSCCIPVERDNLE